MARVDKNAKQAAAREEHRRNIRKQPSLERTVETAPQKGEKFLIVCDGKNTEPSYFMQFKGLNTKIKSIEPKGKGTNTITTVEYAEELKNTGKYNDYEVWCVFDADPKPDNPNQLSNFDNAIRKANALEYNTAYSDEAFEYWLLLHFEDHQGGAMPRALYHDKLNGYIRAINPRAAYDANSKIITPEVFDILMGVDEKTGKSRVDLATERAKRNEKRALDNGTWAERGSRTTVYKLVEKLRGHSEDES